LGAALGSAARGEVQLDLLNSSFSRGASKLLLLVSLLRSTSPLSQGDGVPWFSPPKNYTTCNHDLAIHDSLFVDETITARSLSAYCCFASPCVNTFKVAVVQLIDSGLDWTGQCHWWQWHAPDTTHPLITHCCFFLFQNKSNFTISRY